MKAAAFTEPGAPSVIQYLELDDPGCGPTDVIVKTVAIGLNFADLYRRRGEYAVVPPSPYVLGYEASGTVETVGAEVSRFRSGDRVAFVNVPRANAERVRCPEDRLIPLPEAISFEAASGILLQGMTARYLAHDSHEVRAGETVLVHSGGSGVGALLLQYCRRLGARTIATVSSEEKAAVARESGADEVIVTSRSSWRDQARLLGQATGGIDVIYDAVGSTLLECLAVVRPRGHVVFYGWSGGIAPSVDPRILMDRSLRLSGGDLWSFIERTEELRARAGEVFRDLSSGLLKFRLDRSFPLSETAAAHAALESRGVRGKILLRA